MKSCCMCFKEFKEDELDFLQRCEPCFHMYVEMKDEDKPNLGIPHTPAYNSDKYNNRFR